MYTIIFRKGTIELELTTSDKCVVEKQLDLIIKQASKTTQKQDNIDNITPDPIKEQALENEIIKEEPQAEIQPVVPQFHHITEEEKEAIIQKTDDIIPQTYDISSVKPMTINSLQNPEPIKEPDFDKILNTEMTNQTEETPILKDERFISYVESKSALEKIDFLIIAAQYLAQYENMNTFNLKHINAKLMQNFTLIVDHSILQSAISKEYITPIHQGNDDISTEYMLTEKGLRSY